MGGVEDSQGMAALSFTKVLNKKCHRSLGLMFARNMPWGGGMTEGGRGARSHFQECGSSILIRSQLQIILGLSQTRYFTPTCT